MSSRKDVDMTRKFTFRNSGKVVNFLFHFQNMDGVGTFHGKSITTTQNDDSNYKTPPTADEWRKAVGNGVRLQSVTHVQAQTRCGTMMHKITNTCKKF